MSKPDLFFVYDNNHNISDIVISNSDSRSWVRAKENAGFLAMERSPEKAAGMFQSNPRLHEKISQKAWEAIAPEMGSGTQVANNSPAGLFDETPIDLPVTVAAQRLRLMADHPTLSNPPAQRELTEIVMAHDHERPVDKALFRSSNPESYGWKALIACAPGNIEEMASGLLAEHYKAYKANIARIDNGEHLAPEDVAVEAALLQKLAEVDVLRAGQVELYERLTLDDDDDSAGPSQG
ncbi:hypothetical protein [Marinobacter sp. ELB17]|uniref:hypothetical protein n=1 Tax=Marinobacter sp. ELB17 TaxID=270374 RepID=UPI0000F388C8|nr:hypothetical protein [Marinobacter sp. ELB17]EAZ97296.1 hypothetical protein MELB17_09558 [Marinobacter sp. ELB17]EAZ97332.1 hypothetical protein MELB17_09348 [Marinobacter sp. ELB17]